MEKIYSLKYVYRERQYLYVSFYGLVLGVISFLIIWSYMDNRRKIQPHSSIACPADSVFRIKSEEFKSSSYSSKLGTSADNYNSSYQAPYWAEPASSVTDVSMSTSPDHTTFFIQDLRKHYRLGAELYVTVHARDFYNKPKGYGGDFFQAKLFSSTTKASVFGEVVDLLNGSYSVRFLLPWVGEAQVAVRLIHSSEAVQVLKRHRDTDSDRVFFRGYYEGTGPNGASMSEEVKCNVKWDKNGLEKMGTEDCCCEYTDPRTGEAWRCQRPKSLPCSALVYHSTGEYINRLTDQEKMLMKQTDKDINGENSIIKIIPFNECTKTGVTKKCRPGLRTPVPAGYYLNDVWTSFVCSTRHFTTQMTTHCLKDKHIYMMGDSTLRQWFEFLVEAVPTLKQMNLHVQYQVGPHLAVDVENNIDLHWRSHGLPLRCQKSKIANLHYISNEIDDLAGGPHSVIVFNLGPHFTTYPLQFFTRRVLRIRKAVLALLQRAPDTIVIIKTVNTSYKDIFGSDWFSVQLDKILRWAFQDVGVYIIDVWQMTACHYSEDNMHPGQIIIKNEVDLLLSFICPE